MRRPTLSAWRPRRGEWDREAAAHLWERAGFGPAPGALERALEQGLEATLAELLQPAGHATGAVEAARHLLPLQSIDALAGWWMGLILADGDPLRERVTLMWHDHFATSQAKVGDVRLMHRQNELMRELGLGDFRALMHALSTDPAMLVWLDGDANKRGEPNENFARELMELFGLGIGNYSEQDVQEAARAFTGWGTRGRSFALREGDHDPGTKQLFGERGRFRGEDAIRLVLEQPACARHIARLLHAALQRGAIALQGADVREGASHLRGRAPVVLARQLPRGREHAAGPLHLATAPEAAAGSAPRSARPAHPE